MLGTAVAEMPGGVLVPANGYKYTWNPYGTIMDKGSHAKRSKIEIHKNIHIMGTSTYTLTQHGVFFVTNWYQFSLN